MRQQWPKHLESILLSRTHLEVHMRRVGMRWRVGGGGRGEGEIQIDDQGTTERKNWTIHEICPSMDYIPDAAQMA